MCICVYTRVFFPGVCIFVYKCIFLVFFLSVFSLRKFVLREFLAWEEEEEEEKGGEDEVGEGKDMIFLL